MGHSRRCSAVLTLAAALVFTVAPGASAQDEVGESMCALYTSEEVEAVLGLEGVESLEMQASVEGLQCEWHTRGENVPRVTVSIRWSPLGIERTKQLIDGEIGGTYTELTVGDHPALLTGGTTPPYLLVELDQGVLQITASGPDDYSVAMLDLGELTVSRADTLVPLPVDVDLLVLFPETIGGQAVNLVVQHPSELFPAGETRDAFEAALQAQGKTFSDVSYAGGGFLTPDGDPVGISALRVAGTDVAAFTEFVINAAGVYNGYTVTPAEVTNGIVAIVEPLSGSSFYLYPKDDVAWGVRAEGDALAEILAALPGAPAPPDSAAPPDEPPDDGTTGSASIQSLLPETVGGQALTVREMAAEDILYPAPLKALRNVLKSQGKTIEDVSYVIAANDQVTFAVMALQIPGVDASQFADVQVEQSRLHFLAQGQRPRQQQGQVAGKPVTILRSPGLPLRWHVYAKDDIVWAVYAKDSELTEIFEALP